MVVELVEVVVVLVVVVVVVAVIAVVVVVLVVVVVVMLVVIVIVIVVVGTSSGGGIDCRGTLLVGFICYILLSVDFYNFVLGTRFSTLIFLPIPTSLASISSGAFSGNFIIPIVPT